VAHGTADNQAFHIMPIKFLQKGSLPKAVGVIFLDNEFPGQGLDAFVKFDPLGIGKKK
jgi:hypothetical protein